MSAVFWLVLPCFFLWESGPDTGIRTRSITKITRRNLRHRDAEAWAGLPVNLYFPVGSLQQIGLVYATAGKSGFLTAMYILLVPVFGPFSAPQMPGNSLDCFGNSCCGAVFFSVLRKMFL